MSKQQSSGELSFGLCLGVVLVVLVLAAVTWAAPNTRPLVVAYSADWCLQCHLDEPYYPLVERRWGRLVVVDADESPTTVKAWGVTELPTYFLLRADGTVLRTSKIAELLQ